MPGVFCIAAGIGLGPKRKDLKMSQINKNFMNRIARKTLTTLAAAALGVLVLAPTAQARDKDVDFGIRTDNQGNFGLDLNIFSGRDRYVRPEPRPVVERVWVEPVWRCQTDRIWIDPVYEKVIDRVLCPPVTRDIVTKIYVEPVFEDRETVTTERGRRVVRRERVQVSAGHNEERRSTVVVSEGHWNNIEKWVLKCDGHWEAKERWVCASEGHWEEHPLREVREVREVRVRHDDRDR